MPKFNQVILNRGPAITPLDVAKFEGKHHVQFPESYRAFLLEFNGGVPDLDTFDIAGFPHADEGSVQIFFGLRHAIRGCSLEEEAEVVRPNLPADLMPIASDGGGNRICLSMDGPQRNQVFFWYFHDMPHKASAEDVFAVAPDFETFFHGLRRSSLLNEVELMLKMNDVPRLLAMLDSGYDLEAKNEAGRTILEEAACYNRPGMIQILFDRGARLGNALDLARGNLEYFPEHQASVDMICHLKQRSESGTRNSV